MSRLFCTFFVVVDKGFKTTTPLTVFAYLSLNGSLCCYGCEGQDSFGLMVFERY